MFVYNIGDIIAGIILIAVVLGFTCMYIFACVLDIWKWIKTKIKQKGS